MRSLRRTVAVLAGAALLGALAGCQRATPAAPGDSSAAAQARHEQDPRAHRGDTVGGGPGIPPRTPALATTSDGTSSARLARREPARSADAGSAGRAPDASSRTVATASAAGASAAAQAPQQRTPSPTTAMGAPSQSMAAAFASAVPGGADDASLTRQVAAAIAADRELRRLKIDVDTQNGIVTLSGPAPTASAKARADEVARTVKGVVSVNNQLTLQSG